MSMPIGQSHDQSIAFKDLTITKGPAAFVGEGVRGVVLKATWKGVQVALKPGVADDEYRVHAAIPRHDNIVQVLGMCRDFPGEGAGRPTTECRMVMELCNGGTVSSFAESAPVRVLT